MRRPLTTIFVLSLILLACMSAPAGAEDARHGPNNPGGPSATLDDKGAGYLPYSEPTPFGSGGFLGSVVKAIFSLAIVIGLLYATLWLIRKLKFHVLPIVTKNIMLVAILSACQLSWEQRV